MKISLDLHDFSILNNRLDLLLRFKEHYPKAKISMFTIPYDYTFEKNVEARIMRKDTLKEVKKHLDWIQIIPHGLTHMPEEFLNCDKGTMRMTLKAIDEVFQKDGIPYEKGFCAPYWLWNQDVVDVLNENGWWGATDQNQDMIKPNRFYRYTHSIDQPFWKADVDVLKLHGHIDGQSKNDLEMCFVQLMKIPTDAQWHFVTDFIENENNSI